MRLRNKTIIGRINEKGNLEYAQDVLTAFCGMHKNKSVVLKISVMPNEPSEKLKNYVFGYVIPEMRQALYENGEDMTCEMTYNYFRKQCPVFVDEIYENGKYRVRLKEWSDLDQAEAVEFIAWIQRIASEEYYHIIEDPR